MQLVHLANPLDDCCCLVRTRPVRLRTQKNAQGRVWFHPPLFNQGDDFVNSCEGRVRFGAGLSTYVAGLVSRESGMAPFSRIAFLPVGVKMKSMKASADLVTVVSR